MAGSMIVSPVCYGFAAVLFLAQTGTDYQKLKKGKISSAEFKKRAKYNGVGAIVGIAGASGGAITGFAIGSTICPGIGSGIGTFAGAIVGGILGKKISDKTLTKIDSMIESNRI